MMSINNLNFSSGAYGDNQKINGFQVNIMQSAENVDKVVKKFREDFIPRTNPDFLLQNIFESYNLSKDDFTDSDICVLNTKLNKIYKELY